MPLSQLHKEDILKQIADVEKNPIEPEVSAAEYEQTYTQTFGGDANGANGANDANDANDMEEQFVSSKVTFEADGAAGAAAAAADDDLGTAYLHAALGGGIDGAADGGAIAGMATWDEDANAAAVSGGLELLGGATGGTAADVSVDEIKWCKEQLKAHHVVLGKSWGTLPADYKEYWTA